MSAVPVSHEAGFRPYSMPRAIKSEGRARTKTPVPTRCSDVQTSKARTVWDLDLCTA